MQAVKHRKLKSKTFDKISQSQHVIPNHKLKNPNEKLMHKIVSQKKITSETEIPVR